MTVEELVREINGAAESPAPQEAIEGALCELTAAELVHHRREPALVFPTRAALRLEELLGAS